MIDTTTVDYIATLSQLELTDEEKGRFCEDLNTILKYIDTLNAVSTEGIEPTSLVVPKAVPLRDDIVKQSFSSEDVLKNGPKVTKGHFAVPKVIR